MKKDTPFLWHNDHRAAFTAIKQAISAESCLQYYNPNLPTVVEVDASQKGLGACLLQNDRPIAFASKSLSPAEANYSNIERKTLALVYGITRFHTYLFGNDFKVHTDHKQLENILKKPLANALPRLQRLLIKVQGYKCDVIYKPGSTMILSDTLSRLPNTQECENVPVDLHVEELLLSKEDESIQVRMDLINFGTNKQEVLRRETERDPTLRALIQVINEGWPDTIKELPQDLRPYWSFREQLGISAGVIFKGRQVIIPKPLQSDILSQLHTGHLGIEKTRRLSRESVYWQHINKDIDQLIKSCDICQTSQPQQENEPLIPHEIPSTPWTKTATDLYQIGKDDFLLITDYHSKYPVVYKLPNTSSFTVAKLTAETFSLFRPPKEIISDNGPQFTGQPYKDMCYKWVITHNPSSPRYSKSNGLVERMVRTVKNLIKKSQKSN